MGKRVRTHDYPARHREAPPPAQAGVGLKRPDAYRGQATGLDLLSWL